jgi:hypothetical protein
MRRLAAQALLAALVLAPHAAPRTQRADQLDTPLLRANMYGASDPGDVHFTPASTGDTFPHENIPQPYHVAVGAPRAGRARWRCCWCGARTAATRGAGR